MCPTCCAEGFRDQSPLAIQKKITTFSNSCVCVIPEDSLISLYLSLHIQDVCIILMPYTVCYNPNVNALSWDFL